MQSSWIAVEDRLPNEKELVLCFAPCRDMKFVGYYSKNNLGYRKNEWNLISSMGAVKKATMKVTHWMPLPNSPSDTSEKSKQDDVVVRVETNLYDQEEIVEGCTVQILTNTHTGDVSIGWWKGSASDMPIIGGLQE